MGTLPTEGPVKAELNFSPFITLVADAINFCHLAENPSFTKSARASMVRASILNTVFAIECAANSLLNSLGLSKHIYNQLEKLPTTDKFEAMLLLISPATKFDRGKTEIQAMQELIKIRNNQVHVKSKQQEVTGNSINEAWWTFETNPEAKSSILGIPDNSDFWNNTHSRYALHSLDHFLELYFIDYAGYKSEDVTPILFSTIIYSGKGTILLNEDCIEAIDLAREDYGLNFRYLSFETPNVRVSIESKGVANIITGKGK